MRIAPPPASCKVYTPADLAYAIVSALGDGTAELWLEPSHGKGAFVEAIAGVGVQRNRITAVDLDNKTEPADDLATTVRGVDFLRWASQTERRFDRIVGNPPFVSIAQLPVSLQRSAASVLDLDGRPIGKGANLWYAFALMSLRLLRKGGAIGFVLPSAAEFADYSAEIRRAASQLFGTFELYRCRRPLFDDVQEGTVVVIARNYGMGPGTVFRRSFGTRTTLIRGLSNVGRRNGRRCPSGEFLGGRKRVAFGSVAEIGLGGVTGDAAFFLMNEERRMSLGLPTEALTPVVSRASHLRSAVLKQEDWEHLKGTGERIWLFNPSKTISKTHNVRRYLELERSDGGCNRRAYKVSIRDPWYQTPMPSVADAFLSGMSQYGPWLCINETQRVNATNTLYVVRFLDRNMSAWYALALAFLSTEARRQVRRIGRRYPDGLIKHEPGSISKLMLPAVRENLDHKRMYIEAVSALLSGRRRLSMEIADSALS
jgi:adenine-specific DNA-methyltransferase